MADSKELQTQLQINQQINKVLADRSAQMSGLQKQLTSQTQMAAELCKALECQDLEGLQDRIDGLNQSFKAAADGAQELGSAQSAASQEMAEGLDNAREKSGGLLDGLSTVKTAAVAGGAGFMKAFSGVGGMMKMVAGGVMGVVGNLASVGKAILAVPFQVLGGLVGMAASGGGGVDALKQSMEGLRGEMGDLASGEGKAVMDGFDSLKSSTGALAQSGLNASQVFGIGREGLAKMLEAVGEIAKAAGPNFSMMKDSLAEAADAAVMLNKGMGMSNEALAEMARQAHNGGTSAREAMIDSASMAIQMGDAFGVSAKTVGKNMSSLIENVEDFGNMSKKQLGATATYMAKLGLEAKDLQGVIGKFDDFESAAEGVSSLNQAFGIQLDTMEMMNAQNPAERIDMMKNAFHEAGKSVDDMTRAEKKLMAEQMGLSVSAMENVLAAENQGVAYEDMEAAAEDAEANKMSEKEVMLELSKSIEKLTHSGEGVSGFFDAFKKGFGKGFAQGKGFKDLMNAIRKSLQVVFKFGKKFGKMISDLFGKLGLWKSLKKIFDPAVFEKFFGKALGYFQKFFDALTGKGEYSAAQLLSDLTGEFKNTFGKAGGEAMSGLKTFFIKMIDIAGDVLASALPWIIEKLAGMIQGIADFLADPSAAMNAAKGATEGIGGAFASAFSKIGKALKPVLPKLGAAIKNLFSQLFKIVKPWLIKAFIAVVALSAMKGIAVGLIKGAGTAAIMTAIKFLAKKMGVTMAAETGKNMKKGAAKGAKGGFFKSMGKTIKAIGKINKKDIIMAGVTLTLMAVMFSVGMVAFAGGVFLAYQILKNVPFKGVAKVLVVTLASMMGTYLVAKFASKVNPAALIKAVPGLLAMALLFAVGMVAFAGGVWLATKILAKVKWEDFTKTLGVVATSMIATVGMAIAGAAFFALAPAIPMMIVGLAAAAGLFTAGMVVFGGAVLLSMKILSKLASNEKVISSALGSLITIVKTIGLMGALGAVFAAIGIFVPILIAGFAVAAGFFTSVMPNIEKMVKSLMKVPIGNPEKVAQRIKIIAQLAQAMQSIASVGLEAGKMAIVAESMKPGGMEIMFKNVNALISKVADTLITLIAMILTLGANLTPGQAKNVEIIGGAIGSIAQLASALMSPLEAVSKMSSGMFGPSVTEVMAAVATGLVDLMEKIRTALPSLVNQIIDIAKGVGDPKTLGPKMDIVAKALGAVGNFAKAIEAVAALMPEEGGGFFGGGKKMAERIEEMTDIISGVVEAVKGNIQQLVTSILSISIPNPEKALAKVNVIEKTMSAVAKFAGVVEKMTGMAKLDRIDETIMVVVKEMVSALNAPPGSLQDLFTALETFAPNESLIPKLDVAVQTLNSMTGFTKAMVALSEAGGENVAGIGTAVTTIVEQAKLAITALNSIGDLNASVALENFAAAIGTGSGEFTVSNEPININLNVKVVMDAGKITNVITDKSQMIASGGPTVAAAE